MWFTKKQKDNWILNNREEVLKLLNVIEYKPEPPKEEQKPTERNAIMEIILINNKTDKEYSIKSENEMGISWRYETGKDGKGNNLELLIINQYYSLDRNSWMAIGRFIDFSVLKCNWKTFKIEEESK